LQGGEDAVGAFQKAVELDPRQAFAHFYLGVLYAAMGRREQANTELQRVLEVSNNPMLRVQAQTRIPNIRSVADLGGE
jgi:Flp pilus assembly protein TadD